MMFKEDLIQINEPFYLMVLRLQSIKTRGTVIEYLVGMNGRKRRN